MLCPGFYVTQPNSGKINSFRPYQGVIQTSKIWIFESRPDILATKRLFFHTVLIMINPLIIDCQLAYNGCQSKIFTGKDWIIE
ncbi:hypothetical protein EFS13_07760 [Lentilactobacillus buchneri]|nr:hypothetical protein [Lentilactobacillus buchneri]MCT2898269.1 hypothetical protein [Lentilactobacillus buchneri]MCT3555430.1 hypothetical protein [Lentilactobacillus buchneri]MCT3557373.1 hypothetical protein [Lentilactobacillus buchneri]MCT3560895.1 hypothetical protein [Lentilactobacillus buchneri]